MAIPVEAFFLDPKAEGTLQQQIQRMIADGVLAQRFQAGEKLPSSRKLAAHLGISRITVTIAYTDLVASDYLVSRGRSGYFVSESAPKAPRFNLRAGSEHSHVDWARMIGRKFTGQRNVTRPTDWRSYPYAFIYGQADPTLFEHQTWRACALQALGRKDFEALTDDYYERDDPKLVEYILRQTLPRRGITARPEEILITMGAQNALWICAQILLTQRRTAVMENPGYSGLREILSQTRCNTVFLDVDRHGLPPENLPPERDVVFVTASHHCPTNVTMPIERRRELLERATHDEFVIVEDDYEFEIAAQSTPTPALKAIDQTGVVVYVGSFSKSLFPGLRLGYIVAPEPFIHEARALRSLVLRHPPGHIQRTAAHFLSLGYYDTQITRMAQAFRRRRNVMANALRQHGLASEAAAEHGGSSFWLSAPKGIDTGELARNLRRSGVLIEPGHTFFAGPEPDRSHYRLAYSSIPSARIPEGIRLIQKATAEFGHIQP